MSWKELLQTEPSSRLVMPWLGGRRIYRDARTWRVEGRLPREFGWFMWKVDGRKAELFKEAEPDLDYWARCVCVKGYLAGDRFIPVKARVESDPVKLFDQTVTMYLIEPGLDRFVFVEGGFTQDNQLVYMQERFPLGPEDKVRRAFIDRKESINDIAEVTPALDLAFRFATHQRAMLEERRAELERKRLEEEQREQARRNMGTGLGRRTLAVTDFPMAAKAALKVGGAELLDVRPSRGQREVVVQFRLEGRRFECVVEKETLRIVDSGICLEDHTTNEKGDTYFTLESLPGVIQQAIREGRLHVYRHVDGVYEEEYDEDW